VTEAGTLIRQLDELNRKGFREWEPCPADMWCGKFSSIWPASLINQRYNAALYAGGPGARRAEGAVGFVLAPPPVNHFFCIYPSDGNSMGAIEKEHKGHIPAAHACGDTCRPPDVTTGCSYPPHELSAALAANAHFSFESRFKYNEVIVDAERMKAALPHSLLGIFYLDEPTRVQATSLHQQFLATFGLHAAEFPLMHLSLTAGFRPG